MKLELVEPVVNTDPYNRTGRNVQSRTVRDVWSRYHADTKVRREPDVRMDQKGPRVTSNA